jgi:hypothetical protein
LTKYQVTRNVPKGGVASAGRGLVSRDCLYLIEILIYMIVLALTGQPPARTRPLAKNLGIRFA